MKPARLQLRFGITATACHPGSWHVKLIPDLFNSVLAGRLVGFRALNHQLPAFPLLTAPVAFDRSRKCLPCRDSDDVQATGSSGSLHEHRRRHLDKVRPQGLAPADLHLGPPPGIAAAERRVQLQDVPPSHPARSPGRQVGLLTVPLPAFEMPPSHCINAERRRLHCGSPHCGSMVALLRLSE